jgi:hypothetical protein
VSVLEREGVETSAESFAKLLAGVDAKREQLVSP